MSDLSRFNPTDRFTGLATTYAQYRPSYPASVIDFVLGRCRLSKGGLLVDVGSGTGISSRLFAERGIVVIGVEPNADMRATAAAAPLGVGDLRPTYREGTAEATGLSNGVANVVLAAQAFHWFEADTALREFYRILKLDGWLVLVWNERDERDPFTAAYSTVVRAVPDASAVEVPRGRAGTVLLTCPLFQHAERVVFGNEQVLNEEEFLGRAFSASYAPRDPGEAIAWADSLRTVFSRYQKEGTVVLRYETAVYVAQRRSDGA